jgi:hypothetical protein
VWRGGQQVTLYAQPNLLVQELQAAPGYAGPSDSTPAGGDPLASLGIVLDDRYSDQVIVAKVLPRSPAYFAGIQPGDMIVSFNDQRVSGPDDLVTFVEENDQGTMRMELMREVELDLAKRPAATPHTALRPSYQSSPAPMPAPAEPAYGPDTAQPAVVPTDGGTYRDMSRDYYRRGLFGRRR